MATIVPWRHRPISNQNLTFNYILLLDRFPVLAATRRPIHLRLKRSQIGSEMILTCSGVVTGGGQGGHLSPGAGLRGAHFWVRTSDVTLNFGPRRISKMGPQFPYAHMVWKWAPFWPLLPRPPPLRARRTHSYATGKDLFCSSTCSSGK